MGEYITNNMKITLESEYSKSTIEVKGDDLDIEQVLDTLVRPVMFAQGYFPKEIIQADE